MNKHTKVFPRPIETERELIDLLSQYNLQVATLDGIVTQEFYRLTLQKLGCVVRHAPGYTKKDDSTGHQQPLLDHARSYIGRFWISSVCPFPAGGYPAGQHFLVEEIPIAVAA